MELQQRSAPATSVIKAWYLQASKSSQLVGVKSQAVRNLLEVTPQDHSLSPHSSPSTGSFSVSCPCGALVECRALWGLFWPCRVLHAVVLCHCRAGHVCLSPPCWGAPRAWHSLVVLMCRAGILSSVLSVLQGPCASDAVS